MLGEQPVPLPDPAHHAEETRMPCSIGSCDTRIGPRQGCVSAWPRMAGLDRPWQPIEPTRPGRPVDQPGRSVSMEVAADLVELLAAVADQLASFRHIADVGGEFKQTELAACHLLFHGYVALHQCCLQHHPSPAQGGMATSQAITRSEQAGTKKRRSDDDASAKHVVGVWDHSSVG